MTVRRCGIKEMSPSVLVLRMEGMTSKHESGQPVPRTWVALALWVHSHNSNHLARPNCSVTSYIWQRHAPCRLRRFRCFTPSCVSFIAVLNKGSPYTACSRCTCIETCWCWYGHHSACVRTDTSSKCQILLSSSSSSSSFPLCSVFTLIFPKQTMSVGNTVLQLFCSYSSWCI